MQNIGTMLGKGEIYCEIETSSLLYDLFCMSLYEPDTSNLW